MKQVAILYYKMLDTFLFWPAWQRWFFTFFISSCLITSWYFVFYKPLGQKIYCYHQERVLEQQEGTLVSTLQKNIKELMQKIDNLHTRVSFSDTRDDIFSLEQFFATANQHHLILEQFTMESEQQQEQSILVPFECTYSGDFFAVSQFLENLLQHSSVHCKVCTLTQRDDKTIACLYKGEIIS